MSDTLPLVLRNGVDFLEIVTLVMAPPLVLKLVSAFELYHLNAVVFVSIIPMVCPRGWVVMIFLPGTAAISNVASGRRSRSCTTSGVVKFVVPTCIAAPSRACLSFISRFLPSRYEPKVPRFLVDAAFMYERTNPITGMGSVNRNSIRILVDIFPTIDDGIPASSAIATRRWEFA